MQYELFDSNTISSGMASEVKKLKCPKCGTGLKVSYWNNEGVRGACAECRNCDFLVRDCGLEKEPPWVSELGCEIET